MSLQLESAGGKVDSAAHQRYDRDWPAKFAMAHFHQKVRVVSNDELGIMGDGMNAMTDGLIERERLHRGLISGPGNSAGPFAANVSGYGWAGYCRAKPVL